MKSSLTRAISVVTGLLAAMLSSVPSPSQPTERIVAVGDLHGDYHAYRGIIRAAALVDGRGRWSGGRAIFVQTGDVADRGPDSRRIMRHLMRLQREAARAGGAVIVLVGNHEAMNMIGDLRYVHPGEYAAFVDRDSRRRRDRAFEANKAQIEAFVRARHPDLSANEIRTAWMRETPLGALEHRAAWHPEGEIGSWVAGNPAIAIVQGNLFVHGGISLAYSGLSEAEINHRTREALIARDSAPESIINDPAGPLWYRGHVPGGADPEERSAAADEIRTVLQAHRAHRLIVGHTPQETRIQILHGGQLALIDTGISATYGGHWSYLEIAGGQAVAHSVVPSPVRAARSAEEPNR